MPDEKILEYGKEKGFHRKILERWLSLAEPDRQSLLDLARELKIGANHLSDLLDWLGEIHLRDGRSPAQVLKGDSFSRLLSDPRLGRNDKLKRLKEELRRLRFPRLSRIEGEIQKRIRELKLGPQIQTAVPPGLEGGALTLQLKASSHEELKALVEELRGALEKQAMREIFDLLRGEGEHGEL